MRRIDWEVHAKKAGVAILFQVRACNGELQAGCGVPHRGVCTLLWGALNSRKFSIAQCYAVQRAACSVACMTTVSAEDVRSAKVIREEGMVHC